MPDPIARLNAALVGRYRVERELGEGGMATVYLADDLRHGRKVALKVLKPELAAVVGSERFLAEIRTTANLQHPHILPLHDSGEADGFLFYVMPRVEGESLRERLDREHQLPVDVAVGIATKVAAALHAAHSHGVVHRDVKPANILLSNGEPLVSDFGIALAVTQRGAGRLTETGLSLGTPHYMSPEQATGDGSVGPTTDVWALGCVLYEMLVGEPPYTGSTPQAVLGKIITAEAAAATQARRSVPPNVDAAIRRALEKVPADRFGSAQEFARALLDPGFAHGGGPSPAVAAAATVRWKRLALATSASTVVLALGLAALLPRATSPPAQVARFTIPVGEGLGLYLGGVDDAAWGRPGATSLAFSPDGTVLVYSGWESRPDGSVHARLYTRALDRASAEPIPGTENGSGPFFSPDGRWIGFFAGESLRRVSTSGDDVETIVASADITFRTGAPQPRSLPRGAAWGDDGTIVYGGARGLYRVPAGGGTPELLIARDTVAPGFVGYAQPHFLFLPGGRTVLFSGWRARNAVREGEILALDVATGRTRSLLADAEDPRYVESGHLLFVRQGALMAVAFDPVRVEVEGDPAIVEEDVMQALYMPNPTWSIGAGQLAVSRSGHLVFARGGVYPERMRTMVRVWPGGRAEPFGGASGDILMLRVSPDGRRLAFSAGRVARSVFVQDLVREVPQRLPGGVGTAGWLTWSPDGLSLAVSSSHEGGAPNVYSLRADGTGLPERVAPSSRAQAVSSWSSQGALAWSEAGDIWIKAPNGEATPWLASEALESHASFSSDGNWIVYTSDESGRAEVYVRPYPGPGAAILVSRAGGSHAAWSRDGDRIYFVQPPGLSQAFAMVAVDIDTTPEGVRSAGRSEVVIDPWIYPTANQVRNYDVLPDGTFVASIGEGVDPQASAAGLTTSDRIANRVADLEIVLNFSRELAERLSR